MKDGKKFKEELSDKMIDQQMKISRDHNRKSPEERREQQTSKALSGIKKGKREKGHQN